MDLTQQLITLIIIGITVLISIKAFSDNSLKYKYLYYPYKVNRNQEYYRIISHIFLHADWTHLFFNMFVLFSFGGMMEYFFDVHFSKPLGSVHYILLYFLGGLAAAIWPYMRNKDNPNYMSLGASGAVAAIVFASILWYPQGGIYLFFIPIEIPAWLFGILYLSFEFYMSKKGGSGIAHDAHFGGAIFGIIYVLIINPNKGIEFIHYIMG